LFAVIVLLSYIEVLLVTVVMKSEPRTCSMWQTARCIGRSLGITYAWTSIDTARSSERKRMKWNTV